MLIKMKSTPRVRQQISFKFKEVKMRLHNNKNTNLHVTCKMTVQYFAR